MEPNGQTRSWTFEVGGMTCANCARAIERGVGKLPGVKEASVNLATARLAVVTDPEAAAPEAAVEGKIRALGYTARALRDDTARPAAASEESQRELLARELALTRRAGALAVPVFALHMAGYHHGWGLVLQFVLATVLQFTIGRAFLTGAYRALRNRAANMDVLVALGTSAAWGFSVAVMLFPTRFPGESVFFETSALLVFFIRLGKYLEARARGEAGKALRGLLALMPEVAHRLTGSGSLHDVPVTRLVVGDRVCVRPGEKVPIDGVIEEGLSAIDESLVTGESIPVEKGPGSEVIGGSLNQQGVFRMRTTRVGRDTVLARITRLVEEAQAARAPIERLADRASAVFVPVVVALAVLTFVVWYFFLPHVAVGHEPLLFALTAATAVLVIACPCALGLATPTAVLVGTGAGLSRGILFKNPAVLENIARLDMVILDKTGTLTQGTPQVTMVYAAPGYTGEQVLLWAVAAEAVSNHPLARAVVEYGGRLGLKPVDVADVEELAGQGVICKLGGKALRAGGVRLLEGAGIALDPIAGPLKAESARGRTPVLVAWEGRAAGLLSLADPPRPDARDTVTRLHEMGLATGMLSGDRATVAAAVAAEVGLGFVHAEALPAGKVAALAKLQSEGHVVAMVGDGLNDAAALAKADVGIALGSGTDVAREAGEVVLIRDQLMDVAAAIVLGRATMAVIRQNLFLSLAYNALGIPLAAGVFYPWTGSLLPPEFAGLAMAFSSVSVVANALRLRNVFA